MSRTLALSLGAGLLVSSHVATAQMGLSTQCSREPPTPKGHIVAKVVAAKTLSNGKVQITLDKGSSDKIGTDDDVHLLACDGKAVQHEAADIFSVTEKQSYVIARFSTANLVGAYAAIDSGFESRAPAPAGIPAGYSSATINAIEIAGGKTQIHFTLGAADGLMPGDKGYIATASGGKLTVGTTTGDLVVTRVEEKYAWATVAVSYDSANHSTRQVFVKKSKSSCSLAKQEMTAGNASSFLFLPAVVKKDSDGNDIVIKFDDTGNTQYKITAGGGGTFNNVLPGSRAYLVNNGTVLKADVKVSSSEDRNITVTATSPTALKFTHVRVAQSTCK